MFEPGATMMYTNDGIKVGIDIVSGKIRVSDLLIRKKSGFATRLLNR
jgi:hypothetical protein